MKVENLRGKLNTIKTKSTEVIAAGLRKSEYIAEEIANITNPIIAGEFMGEVIESVRATNAENLLRKSMGTQAADKIIFPLWAGDSGVSLSERQRYLTKVRKEYEQKPKEPAS